MIERWGTGRRDNSENIGVSVNPTPRSYQASAFGYATYEVTAGGYVEDWMDLYFAEDADTHHIHHIDVTADANILIAVELYDELGGRFIRDQGYQKIEIDLPHGAPVKRLKYKIYNLGNVNAKITLNYNGIQNATHPPSPWWLLPSTTPP